MSEPLYDREGMARMIRTFFIEHKVKGSINGKYKPNPRHDTKENWLKAADVCIANGANPKDWVDASFALSPFAPFANQLSGPASIARWKEYTHRKPTPPPNPAIYTAPAVYTPQAAPPPRPPGQDVLSATMVMEEIKDEILLAHMLMQQCNGSPYAIENRPLLLDPFVSIRPHVRVAIAGKAGMFDVVQKFQSAAMAFFSTHPHHTACFEILGYNLRAYLLNGK